MSDSDDTELLLLIPPDFFLLKDTESESSYRSTVIETEIISCNCKQFPNISSESSNLFDGQFDMASSNHYHLLPKQQREIDKINARISQVERSFTTAASDLSTASNRTARSNFCPIAPVKNSAYLSQNFSNNTSTPKNFTLPSNYREKFEDENGILREIDKYLEESSQPTSLNCYHNHLLKQEPPVDNEFISNKSRTNPVVISNNQNKPNTLISLNDLWESRNIENISSNTTLTQLQEERLRRQHCEKTIQALQGKLLEYQQKISVALQVDKSKDNAIINLQEENERMKASLQKLNEKLKDVQTKMEEENNKMQHEILDIKSSKDCLERELSQALNLAAKFQEKNETLEIKVENFSKSTEEVQALYKKQLENMEIKEIKAKKCEEIAIAELKKIQDILAMAQVDEEKASKQASMYKKQFESVQVKVQKLEKLEEQNKNLSESLSELTKREKELLKEFESQKVVLKTHYQHQLEKVVEQKLVEFQSQLDSVEESLKSEARDREKTIAERAIKQLEMINEKNEQEILLINEKHNEEVELYRIQLINASKKIEELEDTLNTFRSRRVDIAEKLHNVMETQWQKALEILTSPNSNAEQRPQINPINLNRDKLDGLSADSGITKPENESFDTPTSSRNKTRSRKHDERLQAYIEMLLNKSPRDLDNLDAILNIPKSNQSSNERSKRTTTSQHSKPPWK